MSAISFPFSIGPKRLRLSDFKIAVYKNDLITDFDQYQQKLIHICVCTFKIVLFLSLLVGKNYLYQCLQKLIKPPRFNLMNQRRLCVLILDIVIIEIH